MCIRDSAGAGGQDKGQGSGPAAQEDIRDMCKIHVPTEESAIARGDGKGFRCLPELGLIYPLHGAGIESAAAHGVECLRGKGKKAALLQKGHRLGKRNISARSESHEW